jgi:hypothetical protein
VQPRFSKLLFLNFSLLICIVFYYPVLNGGPIWDDVASWFGDPGMWPTSPYSVIWKGYAWPLSVAYQKLTFSLWREHYQFYHIASLVIHLLNSLLLFHLGERLKWPFHRWIFLIFLLHPVNVISVSWMIQVKTLLAFLFSILSFIAFDKGLLKKKWLFISFFFFLLSLMAKSASITLPIIFLIYAYKKIQDKEQLALILLPFFLFGLWGGQQLLASPFTTEMLDQRSKPSSHMVAPVMSEIPAAFDPLKLTDTFENVDFFMFLKTLKFYFWHSLFPLTNPPVAGAIPAEAPWLDFLHLFFLIGIFYLLWKTPPFWYLVGFYVLLIPFLGIVPAPYMKVTWVSDQHLYLALPALLVFLFLLLEKIKFRVRLIVPAVFLIFFMQKTNEATHYYTDEIAFYSASLKADPLNAVVVFNLASTYALKDQISVALQVVNTYHELTQNWPQAKKNPYHKEVIFLRRKLIEFAYKKIIEKK